MVEGNAAQLDAAYPDRKERNNNAEHITARVDARLIRVDLENLMGNAWKFTREARDAEIAFGAREENGGTVYFWRDYCAGFILTFFNILFEPFQRVHSDRVYEVTCIGLAIVLRVIQRHGGRIWAEGAPGEGATFYFTTG